MTNERQIIETLWRYGHFFNPEVLKVGIVTLQDLPLLTLQDAVVQAAVRSYQDMGGRVLDELTFKHHGRPARHDGVAGPATQELIETARCEIPDYGPNAAAVGIGSWPEPCQKAGVKFHVAKSGMPSAIVSKWPDIVSKLVHSYGRVGLRMVEVGSSSEANILISFTYFFGGTIGIAQYNSERCSDRVTCKLSSSYVGHNLGLVKHEVGHNCNLPHTSGGTMNPFIQPEFDPNGLWVPSDPSFGRLTRFFGGTPIDGPDPLPGPDIPPPPPPDPVPQPPPSRPFLDWLRKLFDRWF